MDLKLIKIFEFKEKQVIPKEICLMIRFKEKYKVKLVLNFSNQSIQKLKLKEYKLLKNQNQNKK